MTYRVRPERGLFVTKTDKKLFRNLDTTIFMQNHKLTGPQKVVDTIVWMNVECATQNMSI